MRIPKLGDKTIPLSRQSLYYATIDLDGDGNLALSLDRRSDNVTLFGGTVHGEQLSSSISTPGASALQYVTSQTAVLPPATFKTTDYFSTLNAPLLDSKGNLVFYGEITDHEQKTITSRSIWQATLDGGFLKLFKSGGTINIGGVKRTLSSPGQEGLKLLTANNTLIFKASLEGSSNKALVYVDPPSQ